MIRYLNLATDQLAKGTGVGIALLLVLTLPVSVVLVDAMYAKLNCLSIERLDATPHLLSPSTDVTSAIDFNKAQIIRVSNERPVRCGLDTAFLGDRPLGDAADVQQKLLSRYRARLQRAARSPEAPKPKASDERAIRYLPDVLLIDVVLEWNRANEWRVLVDIAFQDKPTDEASSSWRLLPWWHKEGIAPTNELLRVERSPTYPLVWSFSTPTTAEAVCAYLKDYFLPVVKAVNSDYGTADEIRLSPKDFERGIVHPIMRLLPADYGGVSVIPVVFLFNTVNGALQALMFACFFASTIYLAIRYIALAFLPWRLMTVNWPKMSLSICKAGSSPQSSIVPVAPTNVAIQSLLEGRTVERSIQSIETCHRQNQSGLYVVKQLEAWIIYFGLLGTLLYLSLAIMQLRIHPSTAVMQSILASMSITMAQAFLTTIVSSSLQRIVESLREFVAAAEDRVADASLTWREAKQPAGRGEGLRESECIPSPGVIGTVPA